MPQNLAYVFLWMFRLFGRSLGEYVVPIRYQYWYSGIMGETLNALRGNVLCRFVLFAGP